MDTRGSVDGLSCCGAVVFQPQAKRDSLLAAAFDERDCLPR
jgi:hypothetical protein